jgi:hypothetical protein
MARFIFTLTQAGEEVARAESNDQDVAFKEIMHYAMMYAPDGPCVVDGPIKKPTKGKPNDIQK